MSSVKYLDPSSSTSDEADKTESTERSEIYITFRKIFIYLETDKYTYVLCQQENCIQIYSMGIVTMGKFNKFQQKMIV